MYRMEKSGLQNTSPTSHRSNHWLQRTSISSEVRVSCKPLNFAWGWSNTQNVFLVFKKFQAIILKSTTFPTFLQNASRISPGKCWSEAFSFSYFIILPTQTLHYWRKSIRKSRIFTIQFASSLIPPKWVTFNLSTCGAVETRVRVRSPITWVLSCLVCVIWQSTKIESNKMLVGSIILYIKKKSKHITYLRVIIYWYSRCIMNVHILCMYFYTILIGFFFVGP